ncbi:MAG: dienelactone hydrolase family protein [Pseudomonadota bacterium]
MTLHSLTQRLPGLLPLMVLAAACAGPVEDQNKDDQTESADLSDVGMMRLSYVDAARSSWRAPGEARPINAWVWYPAAAPSLAQAFQVPEEKPVFDGGFAARDAVPESGAHPLIVMSHGTGGSAFQMMWLGRRLADAGYVAVAVDHHGNSAAEDAFDPRGFFYIWERPRDLSVLIDRVLADPALANVVDPSRIGAAGFSLGGYTVVATAGGRIDLENFRAFCASDEADPTCAPQTEYPDASKDLDALIAENPDAAPDDAARRASYRDERITAVAAFAPALGRMFAEESLAAIETTLKLIVGDADAVAPAKTNARHIAGRAPGADLTVYPGVGHYAFLNACTDHGRRFVAPCKDGPGVDRAEVHDRAAGEAIAFFNDAFSSTEPR